MKSTVRRPRFVWWGNLGPKRLFVISRPGADSDALSFRGRVSKKRARVKWSNMLTVEDQAARRALYYREDLPQDIDKARTLLEQYSGIPAAEVEPHLREVRDKAFAVFPFGCIGRWRFLDFYITSFPEYGGIIKRLQDGQVFLDAGTCLGYVLRQLAFDGAPPRNLIGADIQQAFIDLGYDLFRDRGRFEATFVVGDMLAPVDETLAAFDGKVDIIHAGSFFHLFSWQDQVKLGERLVRFFKPSADDALLLGRQVGMANPPDPGSEEGLRLERFRHDPKTLQQLWDAIGERTGTRWKVTAALGEVPDWAHQETKITISFSVQKVVE